jgi:hypothetical protein
MAALCPNCKTKLSCGCQRRTASNGTTACSSCIGSYERELKKSKPTLAKVNTSSNQDRWSELMKKFKK